MNATPRLAIVVAVSDVEILKSNLLRSDLLEKQNVPILTVSGANSAAEAYNQGIDHFPDADVIIFVHQDVYIPEQWSDQLQESINDLEKKDPQWAVLGVFGQTEAGERLGRVWDQGLQCELGSTFDTPTKVQTLDELILIVNTKHKLRFDMHLKGFHLYGTDLCASADQLMKNAYVIHAPVVHNSKRIQTLGGSYATAYRYLQIKWKDKLPLMAPCGPITKLGLRFQRIRFGLAYRRLLRLIPNSKADSVNAKQVARRLGYE